MNLITEREMLRKMDSGKPFSITWVTYDEKRGTGGKVKRIEEAQLLIKKDDATFSLGRALTPGEERALDNADPRRRTNPRHSHWYTRNLRVLMDGHPTEITRKFHPPLVLEFNGKRVVP